MTIAALARSVALSHGLAESRFGCTLNGRSLSILSPSASGCGGVSVPHLGPTKLGRGLPSSL